MEFVNEKADTLWSEYQAMRYDSIKLIQMEKENRDASYIRCVIEKRSPAVSFAPEKDTARYNAYTTINANNEQYDFQYSISKRF